MQLTKPPARVGPLWFCLLLGLPVPKFGKGPVGTTAALVTLKCPLLFPFAGSFPTNGFWVLFVPSQLSIGGIIVLRDTSEDTEELVEPVAAHGPKIEEEEQEPEPPEPFEYIDD